MIDSLEPGQKQMTPHLIASGIGLSDRSEIAGLLALFKVTSLVDVGQWAARDMVKRLGAEVADKGERLAQQTKELVESNRTDDELRHMLWLELSRGLDLDVQFPLAERRVAEASAAMGVMVSRTLSPAFHAQDRSLKDAGKGALDIWKDRAEDVWTDPAILWRDKAPMPFPVIVAHELARLLDDVNLANEIDPKITEALDAGGKRAWALVAVSGGWAAMAGAIGAAGFAPYILAAQASAFIPLVSGPAAVSFLAVIVNPVTVVAGIAALGTLGATSVSKTIRRQVAARVAVLLALKGLESPSKGISSLVNTFRDLTRPGASNWDYLSASERNALRHRVHRIEAKLGQRPLPPAAGLPPGNLRDLPDVASQAQNKLTEAVIVAGLTVGEMLYRAAAIDEHVILAADFWRSADLGNPLSFAAHAAELKVAGADVALRGYVAERVVMGQLIADGHDVSLPDSATNPGFDLIVDGEPVQVKCAAGIETLREHFESYPDIPVLVNAELAGKLGKEPWSDLVSTIEGFDLESVELLTEQALQHGVELAAPDIVATALGVGVLRGALAVARGEIPASDLPAWLVVDAALKTPLVWLGGQAGGLIGIIAIGPAGALILGPVLGAVSVAGAGPAKNLFDKTVNKNWYDEMLRNASSLHAALLEALNKRANLVLQRRDRIAVGAKGATEELKTWLDRRAVEDAIFAAEVIESLPLVPRTPTEALGLLMASSRGAPADPKVLKLSADLKRHLKKRPGPLDGIGGIMGQLPSFSWQQK